MKLKPKCGNCNAAKPIAGSPGKVWCHAEPPQVFVTVTQSPIIQGLPGSGGPQKHFESVFPPMDKEDGWCRGWEPDEAAEQVIRAQAQADAQRIRDFEQHYKNSTFHPADLPADEVAAK